MSRDGAGSGAAPSEGDAVGEDKAREGTACCGRCIPKANSWFLTGRLSRGRRGRQRRPEGEQANLTPDQVQRVQVKAPLEEAPVQAGCLAVERPVLQRADTGTGVHLASDADGRL